MLILGVPNKTIGTQTMQTISILEAILISVTLLVVYALIKTIIQTIKNK
jgi:hypothetical protein